MRLSSLEVGTLEGFCNLFSLSLSGMRVRVLTCVRALSLSPAPELEPPKMAASARIHSKLVAAARFIFSALLFFLLARFHFTFAASGGRTHRRGDVGQGVLRRFSIFSHR